MQGFDSDASTCGRGHPRARPMRKGRRLEPTCRVGDRASTEPSSTKPDRAPSGVPCCVGVRGMSRHVMEFDEENVWCDLCYRVKK